MEKENNEFMNSPCRIWEGNIQESGYGRITIYGKTISAHILSCSIKNKRNRKEKEVTRHLCGNKLCINEEHLQFGTQSENAIDAVRHGRRWTIEDIRNLFET